MESTEASGNISSDTSNLNNGSNPSATQDQADVYRLEGNTLFGAGDYEAAITAYGKAIELRASSIAYSNRAVAELKLNQWVLAFTYFRSPLSLHQPNSRFEAAFRDCSTALNIDPDNHKAIYRRAEALVGMGRLEHALFDYRLCLEKIPSDAKVKARVDELLAAGVNPNSGGSLPDGDLEFEKVVLRVEMPFAKERHSHYIYRTNDLVLLGQDILSKCHTTIDEVFVEQLSFTDAFSHIFELIDANCWRDGYFRFVTNDYSQLSEARFRRIFDGTCIVPRRMLFLGIDGLPLGHLRVAFEELDAFRRLDFLAINSVSPKRDPQRCKQWVVSTMKALARLLVEPVDGERSAGRVVCISHVFLTAFSLNKLFMIVEEVLDFTG